MYAELMNENVRIRAENVMLKKVVFALIAQADKDPFMSIGYFAEHGHASSTLAEIRALNDEQEQQPAPDVACRQSRESAMVVLEQGPDGTPAVWCDPEIADLVSALNKAGIRTVASCSGHGHRPGNITLSDGRELAIARDFDEARKIDAIFPGINGEPPMVDVSALVEALTELCDEIDKHEIHAAISKTSISWFKRKARKALAAHRNQENKS